MAELVVIPEAATLEMTTGVTGVAVVNVLSEETTALPDEPADATAK